MNRQGWFSLLFELLKLLPLFMARTRRTPPTELPSYDVREIALKEWEEARDKACAEKRKALEQA